MNKKYYLSIILAVIGLISGIIFSFTYGLREPKTSDPYNVPNSSIYLNNISGVGLVEANTTNINISSNSSGVIQKIYVKEGDFVERNTKLLKLNDDNAKASLALAESELLIYQQQLELAILNLTDEQEQLSRIKKLKTGLSLSKEKLIRKQFAVDKAKVNISIIESEIKTAESKINQAQVNLDLLTILAPIDGDIFKIKFHPGEYLNINTSMAVAMIMGHKKPLHLRVQIDENDLWRFNSQNRATASIRGSQNKNFELNFVKIEPYVQPKSQLNGDPLERVDTRVIEVIYQINDQDSLYIGQLLDVFIEV